MNDRHFLNVITTFATLIPITAAFFRLTTAGKVFRLFLLYLIYGFLTDIFVWQLMDVSRTTSFFLFILFPLVEAIFMIWFIRAINSSPVLIRICNILMIAMIPFWLTAHFLFNHSEYLSALFDSSYEIIVSMLSGFSLLKLAEKDTSLQNNPLFWLQTGIFFYCFTTFFISGFLESGFREKIWWIHNSVNILVYILFTIAFLVIPSQAKK
jgi:hypothetical protein